LPGLGWLGGLSRPQSDRVNLTPSLTQVGDPTFAGFCAARGAEVGARVCAKVSAEERMGVFALRGQPAAMQVECSLSRQPPPPLYILVRAESTVRVGVVQTVCLRGGCLYSWCRSGPVSACWVVRVHAQCERAWLERCASTLSLGLCPFASWCRGHPSVGNV